MKLHHELCRDSTAPLVLAIGFFDGVHRGHREIARQTLRLRKPGWRAGVLTFSNHPAAYLRPGRQPPLLCTPQERIDLLAGCGFDECFFVPFDERIASQEPEHFVRHTLVQDLGARGVVVGTTFQFGKGRAGDAALMESILSSANVRFVGVANMTDELGERISSTRIRRCVERGELDEADRLLGRSYELRGRVVLGAGRGHDLGFPTANIDVPEKLLPKDGVYSAVARYDGRDYAALVSIGTNPTFDGAARTIEAWVRDFHETIYGRELTLRDLRFIREQQRFDSAQELLMRMEQDVDAIAYPSYG